MSDVAVVGAGPAGLMAARALAERGRGVVIVERAERVGGLAASFEVAGQSVDHGSHRLHVSTPPEVLDLLWRLLGDELQTRRRNGRIRLGDRWLPFPLGVATLRALDAGFLARAGLDAALAMLRPRRADTFAAYVDTGLGRAMGERFYFPYASKIWGLDPTEISGEQARRRIGADTPIKLAARLLRSGDDRRSHFYYPAGGFGRISEVLAASAVDLGADLRLGAGVTRIAGRGDRWTVTTTSGDSLDVGQVWSTVPLPSLASMVDGAPAVPALEYRSMVLVYLATDGERYTPYDAHYLPDAGTPVTRISEPKNYRDGPDSDDVSVLCFEIPCDRVDPSWSASDDDLAAVALASLDRSGLPEPSVAGVHVERVPAAYPVYRLGFEAELAPLLDWVDAVPGLLTFGRQGLFAHDNTHHAMAMALAAVDALAGDGGFDRDRWALSRARFAEHVVED